jgi:hypothetical protein
MDGFKVFGSNAPMTSSSTSFETPKEKTARVKAAKQAAIDEQNKKDAATASLSARDSANVNAGLVKINATHGLVYDPITGTYKGGKRKRPTRRSRKTKSKRRKTRKRR